MVSAQNTMLRHAEGCTGEASGDENGTPTPKKGRRGRKRKMQARRDDYDDDDEDDEDDDDNTGIFFVVIDV